MSVVASFLAFAAVGQGEVTFAQIEEEKYKTYAALKDFECRYDVVTLPTAGEGGRQQISLSYSATARRIRIVSNGSAVAESGWTKDRKWLVNHLTKQYSDTRIAGGFTLFDEYKPLPAEAGRLGFSVTEMGPRFNTVPSPEIVSDKPVTEGAVKLRRVEAVTKNAQAGGEVRIIQFFDEGTWMVRRFVVEISGKSGLVVKMNGFLRDDKRGVVPSQRFELPRAELGGYSEIGL